jgi:hypothetical protein
MGRLLAFILGGAALALYGPQIVLPADTLADYTTWLKDNMGNWYGPIFENGPGIFAGLALILIAIRGRE